MPPPPSTGRGVDPAEPSVDSPADPTAATWVRGTPVADDGQALELLTGSEVGGYRVGEVLGLGSSGIVYRAQRLAGGERVAFKVLKPQFAEAPEYIRRLIEEAKALVALNHPGIIGLLDFGALPSGQPYLAMELCEGLSLEDELAGSQAPGLAEGLGILDALLAALGAAHSRGIIHRDLKPSNLFLANQPDGSRHLKVLDFGLARLPGPGKQVRPTRPGSILGTPDYMAPEQIDGRPIGPWTDVYAVGGIAFRLLTGRVPFVGSSPMAVISQKLDEHPPRPSEVAGEVPLELDALVFELLAREPDARPSLRVAQARFAAYRRTLTGGQHAEEDASARPTSTARNAFSAEPSENTDLELRVLRRTTVKLAPAAPAPVPGVSPLPRPLPRKALPSSPSRATPHRGWLSGILLPVLLLLVLATIAWWALRS